MVRSDNTVTEYRHSELTMDTEGGMNDFFYKDSSEQRSSCIVGLMEVAVTDQNTRQTDFKSKSSPPPRSETQFAAWLIRCKQRGQRHQQIAVRDHFLLGLCVGLQTYQIEQAAIGTKTKWTCNKHDVQLY